MQEALYKSQKQPWVGKHRNKDGPQQSLEALPSGSWGRNGGRRNRKPPTFILQPCGHRTALQGSRRENLLAILQCTVFEDTEGFPPP